MSQELSNAIKEAFSRVLEDSAMVFTEESSPSELLAPEQDPLEVRVSFSGAGSGELSLMAGSQVARVVAAGALGLDPDEVESDEDALDALKELMNVTLGQLLTDLAGDEAVFDLSPPQARSGSGDADWEAFRAGEGVVALLAEDHPVLLALKIDGGDLEGCDR